MPLTDLAADLHAQSRLADGAHAQAGVDHQTAKAIGWFNGYYDDDGQRVEGDACQAGRA